MTSDDVLIKIPRYIYDEVEKRVKKGHREFASVDHYVTFVLTELLKDEGDAYTPEEEHEVKENLKKMGYL